MSKFDNIDLEKVDGICYKKENVWVSNKALAFDINRLPLPDRKI